MTRAKQLRLDLGLGVLEAANRARIAPKTLHKIEAGDEVLASALAKLAKFYGVRPTELLLPAVFETNGEAA